MNTYIFYILINLFIFHILCINANSINSFNSLDFQKNEKNTKKTLISFNPTSNYNNPNPNPNHPFVLKAYDALILQKQSPYNRNIQGLRILKLQIKNQIQYLYDLIIQQLQRKPNDSINNIDNKLSNNKRSKFQKYFSKKLDKFTTFVYNFVTTFSNKFIEYFKYSIRWTSTHQRFFIFGCAFSIASYLGYKAYRRFDKWYKGLTEYEILLDKSDYDYKVYGNNIEYFTSLYLTTLNQTIIQHMKYSKIFNRLEISLDIPCNPRLMNDYMITISRDISLILTEMDIRLRSFRLTSMNEMDINAMHDLDRGLLILQSRKADVLLRLTRLQLLSSITTCEDLIVYWKKNLLSRSTNSFNFFTSIAKPFRSLKFSLSRLTKRRGSMKSTNTNVNTTISTEVDSSSETTKEYDPKMIILSRNTSTSFSSTFSNFWMTSKVNNSNVTNTNSITKDSYDFNHLGANSNDLSGFYLHSKVTSPKYKVIILEEILSKLYCQLGLVQHHLDSINDVLANPNQYMTSTSNGLKLSDSIWNTLTSWTNNATILTSSTIDLFNYFNIDNDNLHFPSNTVGTQANGHSNSHSSTNLSSHNSIKSTSSSHKNQRVSLVEALQSHLHMNSSLPIVIHKNDIILDEFELDCDVNDILEKCVFHPKIFMNSLDYDSIDSINSNTLTSSISMNSNDSFYSSWSSMLLDINQNHTNGIGIGNSNGNGNGISNGNGIGNGNGNGNAHTINTTSNHLNLLHREIHYMKTQKGKYFGQWPLDENHIHQLLNISLIHPNKVILYCHYQTKRKGFNYILKWEFESFDNKYMHHSHSNTIHSNHPTHAYIPSKTIVKTTLIHLKGYDNYPSKKELKGMISYWKQLACNEIFYNHHDNHYIMSKLSDGDELFLEYIHSFHHWNHSLHDPLTISTNTNTGTNTNTDTNTNTNTNTDTNTGTNTNTGTSSASFIIEDLKEQIQFFRHQSRIQSNSLKVLKKSNTLFHHNLEVYQLKLRPITSLSLKRYNLSKLLSITFWLRFSIISSITYVLAEAITHPDDYIRIRDMIISNVKYFVDRRIVKPFQTIMYDMILNRRVSITDQEALMDAQQSLTNMIYDFLHQHKSLLSENEKRRLANKMDMSPISQEYERELRQPMQNIVSGRIARLVLIQLQFVKKELLVAMQAIDELFNANQVNLQLLAVTPAILSLFLLQVIFKMLISTIKSSSRGKLLESTSAIYSELKYGIRQLDKLLTLSLENDNINIKDNMELHGKVITQLYRLQLILVLNSSQFPQDQMKVFQEDLRDIASPLLSISQRLLLLDRITKANGFLQNNKGSKFWGNGIF